MRIQATRPGFTLIELLISMVIVAALAMIATQLFWRAKDKGLESSLKSDLKTVATQQEVYYNTNYRYAATPTDMPHLAFSPGVSVTINYAGNDGWAGVATHAAVAATCGLMVGDVPSGTAGPATQPGVVMCTGP